MTAVNPLDRGKNLDILLKTLIEAGVSQSGLAFILGVNPDTLSAYLLRSSEYGDLNIAPSPHFREFNTDSITIFPYQNYPYGGPGTQVVYDIPGPMMAELLVPGYYNSTYGLTTYIIEKLITYSALNCGSRYFQTPQNGVFHYRIHLLPGTHQFSLHQDINSNSKVGLFIQPLFATQ